MYDISPYESNHQARLEQTANIALGRIVDVDVEKRLCTVATITGRGSIFDQYITHCQWLCSDANPDGDEFGSIPRRGSWGIVYFIDGQAYIGNYTRPVGKSGSTLRGNEETKLREGDKLISTMSGNRITIKRSGLIELYVSEALRMLMLPTNNQLIMQCSNHNFQANGGFHDWRTDRLQRTLLRSEYYTTLAKTFVVADSMGYVDDDIVFKRIIGPGVPGVQASSLPVYTQSVGITGETITTISPPLTEGSPAGYSSTIGPDGSVVILAGAAQTTTVSVESSGAVSLDVNSAANLAISEAGDLEYSGPVGAASISATGDISISNSSTEVNIAAAGDVEVKGPAVSMTMSATGDVEIKGSSFTLSLTASGEVKLESNANVTIESKTGGVSIKGVGPLNIESSGGPVSIKSAAQVQIAGMGGSASDFVLTNPTTLSPFTGAPLVPFSQSVMVSK